MQANSSPMLLAVAFATGVGAGAQFIEAFGVLLRFDVAMLSNFGALVVGVLIAMALAAISIVCARGAGVPDGLIGIVAALALIICVLKVLIGLKTQMVIEWSAGEYMRAIHAFVVLLGVSCVFAYLGYGIIRFRGDRNDTM